MEQLRHRLTNVSPKGQTCRADQNPLQRSDLDDFVACFFGCPQDVVESAVSAEKPGKKSAGDSRRYNRFDRVETKRFKSFTYEELSKRDP
jgi:hypothetical protein